MFLKLCCLNAKRSQPLNIGFQSCPLSAELYLDLSVEIYMYFLNLLIILRIIDDVDPSLVLKASASPGCSFLYPIMFATCCQSTWLFFICFEGILKHYKTYPTFFAPTQFLKMRCWLQTQNEDLFSKKQKQFRSFWYDLVCSRSPIFNQIYSLID